MNSWIPSTQYNKVAEANRLYYAKTAELYDSTETCVIDPAAQQMLEVDLDNVIKFIGKPPHTINALDACGGSGNVALKLLDKNVKITLSDISEAQLKIFETKYRAKGHQARTVSGEIGEYLSTTENKYDLIVFSSALHHLEDIIGVLTLAFNSLTADGVIFTVFDPTEKGNYHPVTKRILWLDYVAFKFVNQTIDLPSSLYRKLRRTLSAYIGNFSHDKHEMQLNDDTLGVLAEYHVEAGIDDHDLVENLKKIGYTIIWHSRYGGGRFAVTRFFVNSLGDATQFKLLIQKSISNK